MGRIFTCAAGVSRASKEADSAGSIRRTFKSAIIVQFILALISASLAFAIPACASTDTGYSLGADDIFTVTVIGHSEFSGEFLVPDNGTVDIPGVGQTLITGKTLTELSAYIRGSLSARIIDPEVSVTLKTPREQRVYVLGAVATPGFYGIKPGWRITEALAAAGGLKTGVEPEDCKAKVLGPGGSEQSVSLAAAVRGDASANLALHSGDVLTIDTGESVSVYVMGKVKTPGLYKLRKESGGLMEALALAGGALDDAATSSIKITHLSGKSELVDAGRTASTSASTARVALESGDLIFVPESTARIAVLGFVKQPGYFALKDGEALHLSESIGLAGGADTKRGGIDSVAIIRMENGKQERHTYNLKKFLAKGDESQNPAIKAGDVVYVPEVGKPDWDMVIRALSATSIILGNM